MKFFTPPNQLTFLRILLTPVFLVLFLSSDVTLQQWSVVVFILAALTDWYDGWLARRWGYVTQWGAFFDPLADKVVTSAALIAYAYLGLISGWMVWLIVIRDIFITLLRSYGEYKGKSIDTPKLAKTKTFLQFILIYYILILFVAKGTLYFQENFGELIQSLLDETVVYPMMLIVTALTIWTGIVHIYENRKVIKELYDSFHKTTQAE